MSEVSTTGQVDMERIRADHGLAQARLETQRWDVQQHRLGTSFKQGHRSGFWDGVHHTLTLQAQVEDLDPDEWLAELDKGEGSIYSTVLAADPHLRLDCPRCDTTTVVDRAGRCDHCGHDFRKAPQ